MNLLGLALPPWVKPAIAAVGLLGAFSAGWKVESLRWHAHEAKALKRQEIALRAQLAHQNSESGKYETEREQSRVQSVDRAQSIRTVYKDRIVPGECAVPDGVRSVLDNAVRDANARAAGQPEG